MMHSNLGKMIKPAEYSSLVWVKGRTNLINCWLSIVYPYYFEDQYIMLFFNVIWSCLYDLINLFIKSMTKLIAI